MISGTLELQNVNLTSFAKEICKLCFIIWSSEIYEHDYVNKNMFSLWTQLVHTTHYMTEIHFIFCKLFSKFVDQNTWYNLHNCFLFFQKYTYDMTNTCIFWKIVNQLFSCTYREGNNNHISKTNIKVFHREINLPCSSYILSHNFLNYITRSNFTQSELFDSDEISFTWNDRAMNARNFSHEI